MNLEQILREYAAGFTETKDTYSDCMIINGCIAMYQKTLDTAYKTVVMKYVDTKLDSISTETFALSRALCFLYEETNDEKYRIAMDEMMKLISASKRNEQSILVHDDGSMYLAQELFCILPFYTWYDTKFNKKENYIDIMVQLRYICCHMLDKYTSDMTEKEWLMMMLGQIISNMSEEIYEHYFMVKLYLKTAVRMNMELADEDSVKMAYVLLKGCESKAILPEKYILTGKKLFEAKCTKLTTLEAVKELDLSEAGTLMMTYAMQ